MRAIVWDEVGSIELDVPQVKVPFVEQSSGRCPIFAWKGIE